METTLFLVLAIANGIIFANKQDEKKKRQIHQAEINIKITPNNAQCFSVDFFFFFVASSLFVTKWSYLFYHFETNIALHIPWEMYLNVQIDLHRERSPKGGKCERMMVWKCVHVHGYFICMCDNKCMTVIAFVYDAFSYGTTKLSSCAVDVCTRIVALPTVVSHDRISFW